MSHATSGSVHTDRRGDDATGGANATKRVSLAEYPGKDVEAEGISRTVTGAVAIDKSLGLADEFAKTVTSIGVAMILGSLSLWESVTTGLQSYGIASLSISKEKEGCFSPGVFLKFDALFRVPPSLYLFLSLTHFLCVGIAELFAPLRGTDAAPSMDAQILDLGSMSRRHKAQLFMLLSDAQHKRPMLRSWVEGRVGRTANNAGKTVNEFLEGHFADWRNLAGLIPNAEKVRMSFRAHFFIIHACFVFSNTIMNSSITIVLQLCSWMASRCLRPKKPRFSTRSPARRSKNRS